MNFFTLVRRTPFFSVLDRMVSLELMKTLLSILTVLVIIIVSRKFLNVLAKAIEGEIAGDTLFHLLILKTIIVVTVLLPPSLFMGILTVIGRMYRDQEMVILASGGMGTKRLYRTLGWVVVPIGILSAWLAIETMPWTERQVQALMKRDEATADVRGIKVGRFNEFSAGDVVLYAESLGKDHLMYHIFVQSQQGKTMGVVIAETGQLKKNELGEDFVILRNGHRYQGVPGRLDYVVSEFSEYAVRISGPEGHSPGKKQEAEESIELLKNGTPRELAELQRRLSIPLGVVFLSLLAVPLSQAAPRRGAYGHVLTAFFIYILYENAQKISQGLLITGKISPWYSYTAIYTILLFVTILLFLKNLGWRSVTYYCVKIFR